MGLDMTNEQKEKSEAKSQGGLIVIGWIGLIALALSQTGCGPLLGMEKADLWGAKFEFSQGSDFHVGMNSIDHVDDRRGVGQLAKKNPPDAELPAGGY